MDLLFYGHCGMALKLWTDSSVNLHVTRRHNRGHSLHASQSSYDDSLEGMNPQLAATAAKRTLLSKSITTKNRKRITGIVRCSLMVDINKRGSDSDYFMILAPIQPVLRFRLVF